MDDITISQMIVASLSKIWHLIPIVIAIVLFKKFMDSKAKKHKLNKNEENEKNGLTLNLRTLKKYENSGYKIEECNEEEGIDFVCYKDDKTLLLQCKNTTDIKSIKDEDIKTFHRDATKYVKEKEIKENVEFRYVIPYSDVLHKSAIKVLTNNTYNCKYVVL